MTYLRSSSTLAIWLTTKAPSLHLFQTKKSAQNWPMRWKYPSALRQYTGDILLIGINYDKKSKTHQCVIEKLDQGASNYRSKN